MYGLTSNLYYCLIYFQVIKLYPLNVINCVIYDLQASFKEIASNNYYSCCYDWVLHKFKYT